MKENKYNKCWLCSRLSCRIEQHHVFGKKNSEITKPICIGCHDLIDRIWMGNESMVEYYFKAMEEVDFLLDNDRAYYFKIVFMKMVKVIFEDIKGKQTPKLTNNMQENNPYRA